MTNTPLTILDAVPISSGSNAAQALNDSIELARYAEDLGYSRFWFAEHHLSPGVAGTSPAIVIALIAASTHRIRLGAGAVHLGHRTALTTVEEFGLIDALHPGRIDLGIGHSPMALALPPDAARLRLVRTLLRQPQTDYAEQVAELLALLRGGYTGPEGTSAHVIPGERAAVEVWIVGGGGDEGALVAGRQGLRFAAHDHVNPSDVVNAVAAYRDGFRPAAGGYGLEEPHVSVSADVVVAEDEATARALATSPAQIVGTAKHVADRLELLRAATGADELIITTATREHVDRIRSYELLAEEWESR